MQSETNQEISPVEYARACGLTIGRVYSKIWEGRIPARKQYGRWFIPTSAVNERRQWHGEKEGTEGPCSLRDKPPRQLGGCGEETLMADDAPIRQHRGSGKGKFGKRTPRQTKTENGT
jgi:hypothetical protein